MRTMKTMNTFVLWTVVFSLLAGPGLAEVQNVKVSSELRTRGTWANTPDLGLTDEDFGFFKQRALVSVEADLTDHVLVVVEITGKYAATTDEIDIQGLNSDEIEMFATGQDDGFDNWMSEAYLQASEVFYSPLTLKIGR